MARAEPVLIDKLSLGGSIRSILIPSAVLFLKGCQYSEFSKRIIRVHLKNESFPY
jgi:hypothetical protein